MSTRIAIAIVFGLVGLVTAALPSGIMAAVAQDASLLVLPVLTAVFAAGWGALLSSKVDSKRQFGYARGFAVAIFSFLTVAIAFAFTRPIPYGQAFVAFLAVGWGFLVFPGFVGAAIAVWLLNIDDHEPNSAVGRDVPQAARPSQ